MSGRLALARRVLFATAMSHRVWAVLSTCMLVGCSTGATTAVDLGVADTGADDGDMNASMEALRDQGAAVGDLAGPGVQLVEDFCNADLGAAYTRCYVTQQPIDGY